MNHLKKYLTLWIAFSNLSFWLIPTGLHAREPQIKVEQVLQATQSWDSRPYTSYPAGQPQVTVLRIAIPPNTALHWHRHPIISVGYVLSGHLTLEKRDDEASFLSTRSVELDFGYDQFGNRQPTTGYEKLLVALHGDYKKTAKRGLVSPACIGSPRTV